MIVMRRLVCLLPALALVIGCASERTPTPEAKTAKVVDHCDHDRAFHCESEEQRCNAPLTSRSDISSFHNCFAYYQVCMRQAGC